ncbi:Transposon Ty3-I Gag-Pol polyprotein [Gossypium australe]|uniref:Transposon Ty3-I Gag-Pol polyprotein n=1 Tax=Gossypium australe TaxID=47621 RepID=A0A5B6UHZ7_9ROSI|nr:Transposon Ty3-I Gag-Pol polyprotein [Gossypium australe]
MNYIGNNFISNNNPYGNTYNLGWRNHPNFSWGGQGNQGNQRQQPPQNFQNQPYPQEKKPNLEEMLTKFMESIENSLQDTEKTLKNQQTLVDVTNHQVGKLNESVEELTKFVGLLTEMICEIRAEIFSKETKQVKAVTLRSGKELVKPKKKLPHKNNNTKDEGVEEVNPARKESKPPIPYPTKLKKERLDAQYGKFLELFKQIHINLPFVEAISQMPKYAKFLKEILTNKRKLEEISTVELNEECSAILQNKLPTKLKDPGSFTIPCLIGSLNIKKALADLGASINLMPYKMFKQLDLGEPKPTRMSIQLADRSIKYPKGVIEDILVKIDKFIFPVDFVVLDMDEDINVPLILGRPFLATARAVIDVGNGKLALRIGDEEIIFQIYDAMRYSREQDDACYFVDTTNHIIQNSLQEILHNDTMELCLTQDEVEEDETDELNTFSPRQIQKESIKLPKHLEYAFLGEDSVLPVIISLELKPKEKEELIQVLRKRKRAIAWKISDIKGISPSFCTHKILMEEEYKPCVQPQRQLNPNMKLVVKPEVVPKKGGMTVVPNERNELIPTRTVTGWRVCIDYRKLNDATRKDHFPLPFIDQMLERLSGHMYYCFLDGLSGYFQIPIASEDQEKTTFTCPYSTFTYHRMPFGLCNAPATF